MRINNDGTPSLVAKVECEELYNRCAPASCIFGRLRITSGYNLKKSGVVFNARILNGIHVSRLPSVVFTTTLVQCALSIACWMFRVLNVGRAGKPPTVLRRGWVEKANMWQTFPTRFCSELVKSRVGQQCFSCGIFITVWTIDTQINTALIIPKNENRQTANMDVSELWKIILPV